MTSDKDDYFGMIFFERSEATSKICLNISSKMVIIFFEVHWLNT